MKDVFTPVFSTKFGYFLRHPAQNAYFVWIMVATLMVISLHYLASLSNLNDQKQCLADYNTKVVTRVAKTKDLLEEAYTNQNLLTRNFAEVSLSGKYKDPKDLQEAIRLVFNAHFDRLAKLDEEFAANKLPEIETC